MVKKEPSSRILNIVLVGSFNPAIISPGWLALKKIISDEEASNSKIDLIHREVSKFEVSDCTYEIFLDRCSITTKHAHLFEKLQDNVIKIFNFLKETPVVKVGFNWQSVYEFLESEHDDYVNFGHKHIPKEDFWNKHLKNPGLHDLKIESERSDDYDGKYNFYIKKGNGRSVILHFNDHYEIKGENKNISDASKAIELIDKNFSNSRDYANEILKKLFEYGSD